MIGGKLGEINPLTGDTIIKPSCPRSKSTAVEIEVWHILIQNWITEQSLRFKKETNWKQMLMQLSFIEN